MPGHVLSRIHLGIAEAVEEAFREWQADGAWPELARQLDEAVRANLDVPAKIRAAWRRAWENGLVFCPC